MIALKVTNISNNWMTSTVKTLGNVNSSTENTTNEPYAEFYIGDNVVKGITPVILVLGTFGNVMTILVMRALRIHIGDSSIRTYFMCLAVCDQFVLTFGLGRRFIKGMALYDIRNLHEVVCKLHKFLVYTVSRMAAWILVAMTLQRVLAVMSPLRERLSNTQNRAKREMVCIVVFCCLVDSGILVVYNLQTKNGKTECKPVKDTPQAAFYQDKIVPWLNSLTAAILPSVFLLVNNSILIYKVRKSAKSVVQMTDTHQACARSKQVNSITCTIIVTSLTSILLTFTIPMNFLIDEVIKPHTSDDQLRARLDLLKNVFDLLLYSNSAVNFYLYVLTGPTFLDEVKRILCQEGRQLSSFTSGQRPSTPSTKSRFTASSKVSHVNCP